MSSLLKTKRLVWILAGIAILSLGAALIAFRSIRGTKSAGLHPVPAPTNRAPGGPESPRNSQLLAPSVLSKVEPEYSAEARSTGLEGATILSLVVDEEGNTRELKTIQELGSELDQKAIEALTQWTFHPAMKNGHAVAVHATVEVDFRLAAPPGVASIAIDPSTPATLYAATRGSGVFKTTNGGASWTTVNSGFPDRDRNVSALAIDPSTPATLYAATVDGVFKTTNGAASWTAVSSGLSYVNALAIDPSAPATVYAATSDVFKSTDGGTTWTAVYSSPTDAPVIVDALAIDPYIPSTLYARATNGVFKSTNAGANWTAVDSGGIDPHVFALGVDPSARTTLYRQSPEGVAKSTDGGATWRAANSGRKDPQVFAFATDPFTPATLYSGNQNGVFKSTNGGTSWTAANSGLRTTAVRVLANWELQPSGVPIQAASTNRALEPVIVQGKNLPELQKVRRVILLDDIDQDEDLTDQALSAQFFAEVFKKLETLTCFQMVLMKDAPPPGRRSPSDGYAYLVTMEQSDPIAKGHVSIFYNASVVNNGVTFWDGGQIMYFADDLPDPAMPERVAGFLGSLAKDACPGWKHP